MTGKKGFTLIELLVVIAIIALLLSIVIPSLSLAKERAMEILCETNIRQFGFAMVMYCDTNNGVFSDCEDWLYLNFVPSVYPANSTNPKCFYCVWHNKSLYPDGMIMDYLSDNQVQLCPLFKRVAIQRSSCAQGAGTHNSSIPIDPVFSYSQNVFLGKMGTMPIDDYVPKITQVKSPSTVFAYGEENPFAIPPGARPRFISSATSLNDCLLYVVTPATARSTIESAGGKFNANIPFSDCFGSFHRAKDRERYLGYSKAVFVDCHIQNVAPEESLRYGWPF